MRAVDAGVVAKLEVEVAVWAKAVAKLVAAPVVPWAAVVRTAAV